MTVDTAIQKLTDEAQLRGAECNDEQGIVRRLVLENKLGFNAWFCVCCELADREARKDGFKNSIDRALKAAFPEKKKNESL